MANFTGTRSNDTFTATSGSDTFYFGENEGVDLIFKFDVKRDKLAYTDRSVDGFDDLEITRLQNGDAVIESNDQFTVLQGVNPDTLVDSDFVFTTSGPRYDISRSRSPARRPPNEVNVRDIQRRERAAGYPTSTPSSGKTSYAAQLVNLAGANADGTSDAARTLDVTSPGQTIVSGGHDTILNHAQPNTNFVFDPGHGATTIYGFLVDGFGHDTLTLPQSDFTNIADVLRHTQATPGGAVIHDPTTGDTVRLAGVSKAELIQHRRDISFHD